VLNKIDMIPEGERAARVKDFVKRYKTALKIKASETLPVFEISALAREGTQDLVRAIYEHVRRVHDAEQAPVDIDPRFA
jgi:GTPase